MDNPLEQTRQLLKHSMLRAEVAIASVLENKEVKLEDFILLAKGLFERPNSPDIFDIAIQPAGKEKNDTLHVYLSREGLYDGLPEAMFHRSSGRRGFKELDDMLAESKQRKEEETEGRTFFLPFEQEFFRKRLQIEQTERQQLFEMGRQLLHLIFRDKISAESQLDEKQKLYFLLPLAHRIAGDISLMEAAFSMVLKESVNFKELPPKKIPLDKSAPRVGQTLLGKDLVLGNQIDSEQRHFLIKVGPVKAVSLPEYLENGRKWKLMELLVQSFVPAEYELSTEISVKKGEAFYLDETSAGAFLGFSTIL